MILSKCDLKNANRWTPICKNLVYPWCIKNLEANNYEPYREENTMAGCALDLVTDLWILLGPRCSQQRVVNEIMKRVVNEITVNEKVGTLQNDAKEKLRIISP